MGEPRTRIVVSKAVKRARAYEPSLPPIWESPGRTQLVMFVAVNGPTMMPDIARATKRTLSVIRRQFYGLERLRIMCRRSITGSDQYIIALDSEHPAAQEIQDLALTLHRQYPVPVLGKPRQAEPLPLFPSPPVQRGQLQKLMSQQNRTSALCLIAAAGEIEATFIGTILGTNRGIEQNIGDMHLWGILRARAEKNRQFVSLDPEYFAYTELKALLDRLIACDPEYTNLANKYKDDLAARKAAGRKLRGSKRRLHRPAASATIRYE